MFEIRVSGPIEVLKDGVRISGFRSQKTPALLLYLIVEERRLAGLAIEIGDFEAAGTYLEEAEERLREVQPVEEACRVKLTWPRLWQVKGEPEGAGAAAEAALAMVQGRNARLEPACTVRLAQVRAAADWATADDMYEQALPEYGALRQEHLAVEARAGLAEAALGLGDTEAARSGLLAE